MTERDLFLAVLDLPDPAARGRHLHQACGPDAALRGRVEALLHSHEQAGSFLGVPAVATPDPDLADTRHFVPAPDPEPLTFLAPPGRPDSLGRLGRYEVLEVLGRGGFGIVFRAFDEVLRRVVAVKVLAPQLAATSPARQRFLREARASARVRHGNVVQVYEVAEQPLPHLVMEFIPGETLQQRLDRAGPLGVAEVLRVGRQLADGLAAAHAHGLVHRDIKPANVLLESGPRGPVKLTDFGLARAADDASLTHSGQVAGTPMYMAPEQAKGEHVDPRADLFSLGSVLYLMCSGRPPFRANGALAVLKRVAEDTPRPIREIIPETPGWLCDLVSKLHAKDPADRYQTAGEVADLLARRLDELEHPSLVAERLIVAAAAPRPPRRWAAALAAGVLLAAGGGLGFAEAAGVTNVRGTVVRLFSPEGTLVVEVDDPGVSVTVDGSDLVITGAGVQEIRLKAGRHQVEASKGGKVVRQELVTVARNGRQVVRVSREAAGADGQHANDPDRRAAELVLDLVGAVRVNDDAREIRFAADLPREPFRLTAVSLRGNKVVTDADLAAFRGCKHLTHLDVSNTPVTDAGLVHFKDGKALKVLFVSFTAVGDAGVAHFDGCKGLTDVELRFTRVTDAGLAIFKGCRKLTYLNLTSTDVSDAGLARLKDCRSLKSIPLDGTRVTDAGLVHLKNCTELTELVVPGLPVTDAGLAHLRGCRNLTVANLDETAVTDAGLAQLEGCVNLTCVAVRKAKVTAAGVDRLKAALPKCQIEWDGGVIPPR